MKLAFMVLVCSLPFAFITALVIRILAGTFNDAFLKAWLVLWFSVITGIAIALAIVL